MAGSVYNTHNEDLFDGLRNFKDVKQNQEELARNEVYMFDKRGYHDTKNISTSSKCSEEPTNASEIRDNAITKRRARQKSHYARLTPEQKQNRIKRVVDTRKRKKEAHNIASISKISTLKNSGNPIAPITSHAPKRNQYAKFSSEEKQNYIKQVIENRKKKKGVCDLAATPRTSPERTNDTSIPQKYDARKNRYATWTAEQKQSHIMKVQANRKRKREMQNLTSTSSGTASSNNGSSVLMLSELHKLCDRPPCNFCFATKLESEPPSFCCQEGKVHLPTPDVPDLLKELFTAQTAEAVDFRRHIRAYNSIFSFTSMGVKLDTDLASSRNGVYTFRAQGQIYHSLPSLIPSDETPCYFQMYFYDTDHEVENRLGVMNDKPLSRHIVEKLIEMLHENPYAQVFRRLTDANLDAYEIHINGDVKLDQRVYNKPTADQVAAIWIEGNNPNVSHHREIVVHSTSGHRHKVQHYFSCYDPLQYPLFFPRGEVGWHQNILKRKREELNHGGPVAVDTCTLASSSDQQDSHIETIGRRPCTSGSYSAEAILSREKQG